MSRDLSGTRDDGSRTLFVPSRQETAILAVLGVAALGVALFFRYAIVQNAPLGLACDAGAASLVCALRSAVIVLFIWNAFGAAAMIAAAMQVWRPNATALGIGLVLSLSGLVLYNTRLSALAAALLVLSLARPAPEER